VLACIPRRVLTARGLGRDFSFGFGVVSAESAFVSLRFPIQQGGGIQGFLCFRELSNLCAAEFVAADILEGQLGGSGLWVFLPLSHNGC
jgi:hypothetical protein